VAQRGHSFVHVDDRRAQVEILLTKAMRKRRAVFIFTILLMLGGIAAILIGFFAFQLGMDNNAEMGEKRKLLVGLGIALLLIRPAWTGLKLLSHIPMIAKLLERFRTKLDNTRFFKWISSDFGNKQNRFLNRNDWIWVIIGGLLISGISYWYLTAGTFHLIPYSTYFDRQAEAFKAGQFALLENPPAELAQLPNVFDWRAREGIDYLWDASYYQGKYYLYWGPVPALVALGIKLIHPGVVEDQLLVLLFISGLAFVMGAFYRWLRRSYFPSMPGWTVLIFTCTTLFATPVFWLINRPSVYEAAIASAQFFLLLGVFCAFRGLASNKNNGWLFLSGFALGAAVGSRFTYTFTIFAISLVVAITLFGQKLNSRQKWESILLFGLPLAIWAFGIGSFNYLRFGSIIETGMKYQLTGDALPENMKAIFSLGYFIPNSYSALFRPFGFTPGQFPFLSTPYVLDSMWANFIHRPPTYYFGEPVTGVLVSIPFLWMMLVPGFALVKRGFDWINQKADGVTLGNESFPRWGKWLISGALLVQYATTMCFVMTTMRYLADFVPLFILGTVIAIGSVLARPDTKNWEKRLILILTTILCAATLCIGLLVNLQGADYRFQKNNPVLFEEISTFFTSKDLTSR
jgi:hypothetical protein